MDGRNQCAWVVTCASVFLLEVIINKLFVAGINLIDPLRSPLFKLFGGQMSQEFFYFFLMAHMTKAFKLQFFR